MLGSEKNDIAPRANVDNKRVSKAQLLGEKPAMNKRQKKWMVLAAAGSMAGIAMLLLFRSIPVAAGTATVVIVGIILLKHLALAIIIGSPLTAVFQSIKPKIRSWCPFAKP